MQLTLESRFAGIDLGEPDFALVIVDAIGNVVKDKASSLSLGDLDAMVVTLRQAGDVFGVAVERVDHPVVVRLLEEGFRVFRINPKLSATWREAETVAGIKCDSGDAGVLANGLRAYHPKLHAFEPDDDETRRLAIWCRDEVSLIRQRTALVEKLIVTLKLYFPGLLDWFDDWTRPTAMDFIVAFPSAQVVASAPPNKLRRFLKARRVNLTPLWEERIAARAELTAWPVDAVVVETKSLLAVTLAKQIRQLNRALDTYRERIEAAFAKHPDARIFASLPRSGRKLAPRLLAHLGSRRERFDSAGSLQQLSGCAPVSHQSGQKRGRGATRFRWACQKNFRHTMYHFAFQTTMKSPWARAFYDRARAAGQSHPCALRNLGGKWLKIIYRMWQTGETYDEQRYQASLRRRRSPLAAALARE